MNPLKTPINCWSSKFLLFTSILILIHAYGQLNAQETASGNLKIYPSFGIAAGFFNPGDVNDYIAAEYAGAGMSTEFGTTDIFASYEIKAGLNFRLKRIDFSGELAFAIAPKWIIVENGSNMSYYFNRVSPGMSANYYIPMKSKRMEFFLGGGVQYHFMKFKGFNASSPGFSLRTGVSMQFGKFNMQPYVSFLYAKSEDKETVEFMPYKFEMNYTSGIIGIILSFHRPIDRN